MTDLDQLIGSMTEPPAMLLNLSGGKDSTRMLGLVRQKFPSFKTYAVMADTGFEHVKPIPAVEWCREIAAHFGLSLTVVRNPNKGNYILGTQSFSGDRRMVNRRAWNWIASNV